MFRQFARLPLRRCLHSQASTSTRTFARPKRSVYALGASVAVAGYLAWSLSSNGRHLSLDAEPVPTPKTRPAASKPASSQHPDAPTSFTSSASQSDASELDITSPKRDKSSSSSPTSETPAEGEDEHAESSAGGAFNPETGEINWDCPCLGGMAHGPCGQQFREAFSCFVYSEAEPKGMDCVEKFKAMQDCFREHPEVYGDEIMGEDDDEELPAGPVTTEDHEGKTTIMDTLSTEQKPTSPSS